MSPRTPPATRSRRTRLVLFGAVFLAVTVAGLFWDLRRPPVYRAGARLHIEQVDATAPTPDAEGRAFLTQCEVLTSRPLLEQVSPALIALGLPKADPVAAAQARLAVEPVANTHVAMVTATGTDPDLLSRLVQVVVSAYQVRLAEQETATATATDAELVRQTEALEGRVTAAREELAAFGGRNAIVSVEREESEATSHLKGLQTALNNATEALATAEGRQSAVRGAIRRGEPVISTADQRTIAVLKQRQSELKERWAELAQRFPAKRLAIEPEAILLKTKLARLDDELAREGERSQQAALADATQQVEAARSGVARLRQEVATQEREAQAFSARFQEYQAKAADLERLESLLHDAREKSARLAAGVEHPHTTVEILEGATRPTRPVAPPYWRDGAICLGVALGVALAAVWLFDFLTRPAPLPAAPAMAAPSRWPRLARTPPAELDAQPVLELPPAWPRELSGAEIATLLDAAAPPVDLLLALLFAGATAEEAANLGVAALDLHHGRARVGGASGRDLRLAPTLLALLRTVEREAEGFALAGADGAPPTPTTLNDLLACTATDAGLERPHEVTTSVVRHTLLAHLVRQGLRLAELPRVAGPMAPATLAAYGRLSPPGPGLPLEAVDLTPPGV